MKHFFPLPFLTLLAGMFVVTHALGEAKPDKAALKARLTEMQYYVTQENGTEPLFKNEYYDNHKPGIYVCVVSGEPLFSSLDKFDSGTGWPSFTKPISPTALKSKKDLAAGTDREEIRSAKADSHLGHVFDDGPAPTHLRYCINSAALKFIPADKLEAAGFPELTKTFNMNKITK